MASPSTKNNNDGPVAVVRRVIARRLGTVLLDRNAKAYRCKTKDPHTRPRSGSEFVLFNPRGGNCPWLWEDVLTRVTDNRPLLYSKAVRGCSSVHTWVLPRNIVEKMVAVLATDTKIITKRDTDMVLEDKDWFWQPAGEDRHHMKINVTDCYQEWKLEGAEAGELQAAFSRPRKMKKELKCLPLA